MASNGIRDKVAIVGMGCTPFGERWDKSVDDLLVDAVKEASTTSGIPLADVDPATVAIGDRVEMSFRKISTANGIHNYFWKARPAQGES